MIRLLASKLYVTDKTISSWESNRTEPSLEMIIKLSEILQCSASYLLYGENEDIKKVITYFIFSNLPFTYSNTPFGARIGNYPALFPAH